MNEEIVTVGDSDTASSRPSTAEPNEDVDSDIQIIEDIWSGSESSDEPKKKHLAARDERSPENVSKVSSRTSKPSTSKAQPSTSKAQSSTSKAQSSTSKAQPSTSKAVPQNGNASSSHSTVSTSTIPVKPSTSHINIPKAPPPPIISKDTTSSNKSNNKDSRSRRSSASTEPNMGPPPKKKSKAGPLSYKKRKQAKKEEAAKLAEDTRRAEAQAAEEARKAQAAEEARKAQAEAEKAKSEEARKAKKAQDAAKAKKAAQEAARLAEETRKAEELNIQIKKEKEVRELALKEERIRKEQEKLAKELEEIARRKEEELCKIEVKRKADLYQELEKKRVESSPGVKKIKEEKKDEFFNRKNKEAEDLKQAELRTLKEREEKLKLEKITIKKEKLESPASEDKDQNKKPKKSSSKDSKKDRSPLPHDFGATMGTTKIPSLINDSPSKSSTHSRRHSGSDSSRNNNRPALSPTQSNRPSTSFSSHTASTSTSKSANDGNTRKQNSASSSSGGECEAEVTATLSKKNKPLKRLSVPKEQLKTRPFVSISPVFFEDSDGKFKLRKHAREQLKPKVVNKVNYQLAQSRELNRPSSGPDSPVVRATLLPPVRKNIVSSSNTTQTKPQQISKESQTKPTSSNKNSWQPSTKAPLKPSTTPIVEILLDSDLEPISSGDEQVLHESLSIGDADSFISISPESDRASKPKNSPKKRRRVIKMDSSSSDDEDDFKPTNKKSKSESPMPPSPSKKIPSSTTSLSSPRKSKEPLRPNPQHNKSSVPSSSPSKVSEPPVGPKYSDPPKVPSSPESNEGNQPLKHSTQEILDILQDDDEAQSPPNNNELPSSPEYEPNPSPTFNAHDGPIYSSGEDEPSSGSDHEDDGDNNNWINVSKSTDASKLPKKTKLIENPPVPPLVFKRLKKHESMRNLTGGNSGESFAQGWLKKRQSELHRSNLSPASKRECRNRKLKELAEKEKEVTVEETTPVEPAVVTSKPPIRIPAGVKLTSKNRNQGLVDSITGMGENSKTSTTAAKPQRSASVEGVKPCDVNKNLGRSLSSSNQSPPDTTEASLKLPLERIQEDMDKKNKLLHNVLKKQELEAQKIDEQRQAQKASIPVPSVKESSKNLMTKPGAFSSLKRRTPSPAFGSVNHVRRNSTGRRNEDGLYDEDDPYHRMLYWNVLWLHEQLNMQLPPPIFNKENVDVKVSNFLSVLDSYVSYTSYLEVFYPLIMLELWTEVSNEFHDKSTPVDDTRTRCLRSYNAEIRYQMQKEYCPAVKTMANRQPRKWYLLTVTSVHKTDREIDQFRDFCIVNFQCKNNKDGGRVMKKAVFGMFLANYHYDRIESSKLTVTQKKLIVERKDARFICTASVFCCNLPAPREDILWDEPMHIQRICYVSPKLREVKALLTLPESKLFNHIISPPIPNEVWDPRKPVPSSQIVTYANKTLNQHQKCAVSFVYERLMKPEPSIMMIHGPPGTGKTRTIVGLVTQILFLRTKEKERPKILVCTPSNTALDELMLRLAQALKLTHDGSKIRMVRLGECNNSNLREYSLDQLVKNRGDKDSTIVSLKKNLDTQRKLLDKKKSELDEAQKTQKSKITIESIDREVKELEVKYENHKSELERHKSKFYRNQDAKKSVLEEAHIVCSTLNSCASCLGMKALKRPPFNPRDKEKPKDRKPHFTCCIVDEASQATEPETLTPLLLDVEKMVLVGDPHQLGATVLSQTATAKNYGRSLFTRLYTYYESRSAHENPIMMLVDQYRMHPEILEFPNQYFYHSKLRKTCLGRSNESPCSFLRPYMFMNLSSKESSEAAGRISNDAEKNLVVQVLKTIDVQCKSGVSIGIITPYAAQRFHLTTAIEQEKKDKLKCSVEVDTVDSFQGREKDIIIMSCVRTDATGFLKNHQRLNVALTRARYSLIIIGDGKCLSTDPMWRTLIDNAKERLCHIDIPVQYCNMPGELRRIMTKISSPEKSAIPDDERIRDSLGTT